MVNPRASSSKAAPLPAAATQTNEESDIAFQTSLDDSVNALRSLVDSLTPKNLGPQWKSAPGTTLTDANIFKQRIPRLGLGAVPSAVHAQAAADAKLKSQLLNTNKRAAAKAQEAETNALASGSNGTNGHAKANGNGNGKSVESSEDEEDSRAGAISQSKKRMLASGSRVDPFSSNAPVSKKKSKKNGIATIAPVTTTKRQASPNPSIPPPSSSPSVKNELSPAPVSHEISAKSFYGTTTAPSLPATTTKSTKNQRKKERERVKAENLRRARLLESEGEELGSGLDSIRNERFESVASSSGTEDGLSARKGGGGVRAPVDSDDVVEDEEMQEAKKESADEASDEEIAEVEEQEAEPKKEAPIAQGEPKVKKDRSAAKERFKLKLQAKSEKKVNKKEKKGKKLIGKKARGPKNQR